MSQQLKPESVPPMKKQNSYTYWVDPNNKSRQLPPEHRPKKIQTPIQSVTNEQGPSAWNACGTWQQKKILLSQIQASISQLLKQILKNKQKQLQGIQIGKIQLEGDAYKVFKKNKWNVVYQLKGSIQFKKQQNKAKIKLVQLSNVGDRQYEVSGNAQVRKIVQREAQNVIKGIQGIMLKHNN